MSGESSKLRALLRTEVSRRGCNNGPQKNVHMVESCSAARFDTSIINDLIYQ
jgi:hypothetical protein